MRFSSVSLGSIHAEFIGACICQATMRSVTLFPKTLGDPSDSDYYPSASNRRTVSCRGHIEVMLHRHQLNPIDFPDFSPSGDCYLGELVSAVSFAFWQTSRRGSAVASLLASAPFPKSRAPGRATSSVLSFIIY